MPDKKPNKNKLADESLEKVNGGTDILVIDSNDGDPNEIAPPERKY